MSAPAPSTTEFDLARSGILVGVVGGASAAVLFGLVLAAGVVDVLLSLVSPRPIQLTSLLVAGFGAMGAGVFGLSAVSSFRTLSLWQNVHARSVFASATLGAPRRTGARINRRYLYEIPLTVTSANRPAYDVVAQWFVPSDVRDHAHPGAQVVVRVDALDPSAVLVDWDRTRAAWGLPPPAVD